MAPAAAAAAALVGTLQRNLQLNRDHPRVGGSSGAWGGSGGGGVVLQTYNLHQKQGPSAAPAADVAPEASGAPVLSARAKLTRARGEI